MSVPWKPTVAEVAGALRRRTHIDGALHSEPGAEAGTFTEHTRPTAEQAEGHIAGAVREVATVFLNGVPASSHDAAWAAAKFRAALAIELSYFEQDTEASPYIQLRQDATEAMERLVSAAQARDMFGECPPEPQEVS